MLDRTGMVGRVGGGVERSAGQRVGDPDGRIFLVPVNSYAHPQLSAGPGPATQPGCIRPLFPHVEWADLPSPSPSKWSFPSRAVESFAGISLKPCLEWQKSQWWVRAPAVSGEPSPLPGLQGAGPIERGRPGYLWPLCMLIFGTIVRIVRFCR